MDLLREKTEIPCIGGGRAIKTTYGNIERKSNMKSSKGHTYKFKLNKLEIKFKKSEN